MAAQNLLFLVIVTLVICVVTSASPIRKQRLIVDENKTVSSVILGALGDNIKDTSRSRTRRSVDDMTTDLLAEIESDAEASPSQRRHRRSAVFYLTASMHFCKNYPLYCQRIQVEEGDVKLKIRLADA